jgi:ketosteroid isomerase-like protein
VEESRYRPRRRHPKADFWRFRDGKVVEFHEFYDTAALYDAAR